jgi:magnesium-transporting ATPase (P-type)
MHLLAVTAVEDLLQDDVKTCIEDFRRAKISVWMLTGDKGLTAEEIGVACGLMPQKEDLVAVETLPTQGMASQGNVGKPKSRVFDISEDLTEPTDLYE